MCVCVCIYLCVGKTFAAHFAGIRGAEFIIDAAATVSESCAKQNSRQRFCNVLPEVARCQPKSVGQISSNIEAVTRHRLRHNI